MVLNPPHELALHLCKALWLDILIRIFSRAGTLKTHVWQRQVPHCSIRNVLQKRYESTGRVFKAKGWVALVRFSIIYCLGFHGALKRFLRFLKGVHSFTLPPL